MKIILEKGQGLFFTSDTHYNHSNICRATTNWNGADNLTRDYKSLEHMNSTLVNRINELVGENDILIHLGDWSFGGFENVKIFRDRIVCQEIHLILGNHDHHIENNRGDCQELFASVNHYTKLMYKFGTFVLMHYPMASWDGLNKGHVHLHGHVHLPTNLRFGKGKKMDVGIDGNPNFGVYDMDDIVRMIIKREIVSDMLFDHHTDEIINKDNG